MQAVLRACGVRSFGDSIVGHREETRVNLLERHRAPCRKMNKVSDGYGGAIAFKGILFSKKELDKGAWYAGITT